jgi:hypothetical protein
MFIDHAFVLEFGDISTDFFCEKSSLTSKVVNELCQASGPQG